MANYVFSTITEAQAAAFDITKDVLIIDAANINGIKVAPGASSTAIMADGRTVTLGVATAALTSTNLTLVGGGAVFIGDDTSGTVADPLANIVTGPTSASIMIGLEGNDTLTGNTGADVIYGNQGNDSLAAAGGNDTVYGGQGNDTITGNTGDEIVYGNMGNDSLTAAGGNDTVYGGQGNDTIVGTSGNNTLLGNLGDDSITAGSGNDLINGGDGNDTITAAAGGNNTIMGGAGADSVTADGAANDLIYGNLGADTVVLSAGGKDTVFGGQDNDRISFTDGAGAPSALIYGNLGDDLITVTTSGGANNGSDTVYGGQGADTINATFGGSTGNVVLHGNLGDDVFVLNDAMTSASTIVGGDGTDSLRVAADIDLSAGTISGVEKVVFGGAFSLTAEAAQINNISTFDAGGVVGTAQLILKTAGAIDLSGKTVSGLDSIVGTGGVDVIVGSNQGDVISGAVGNDQLFGGAGADSLSGGTGTDVLDGGAGTDTLFGGAGVDTMTGGEGADLFVYSASTEGTDVITDFTAGTDKFAIADAIINPVATANGDAYAAGDYVATHDAVTDIVVGDSSKLIELQTAQTTTQISTGAGGAADALVLVFNSTTGKGELWYDNDWSDAGSRVQLATLDNVTTLTGVTDFTNADFVNIA